MSEEQRQRDEARWRAQAELRAPQDTHPVTAELVAGWQALLASATAGAEPVRATYRARLAELEGEPESVERDTAIGELWRETQQQLATLRQEYYERAGKVIEQLRREEWERAREYPQAGLPGFTWDRTASQTAFAVLLDGDIARSRLQSAFALPPHHAALRSGHAPRRMGDFTMPRSSTVSGMPTDQRSW